MYVSYHQPAEPDQITLFKALDLCLSSPKSGDQQYKLGVSETCLT